MGPSSFKTITVRRSHIGAQLSGSFENCTGSIPEINISNSEYPFFVALWNKGIHICGASILTKDMILTAAHCVYNIVNPMDMEAFFGVSSKNEILNKARFMIV